MRVDFFNNTCIEGIRKDKQFGICDEQNGTKAYTDKDNQEKWIASVNNESSKEVTFTAIDNCMKITKPGSKKLESTCDGMLSFDQGVYFVELKDQQKYWIPQAKSQLKNTIRLFLENHPDCKKKFRKAFACNKKHPSYRVIESEEQKRFFAQFGFRFDINAIIKVK